MDEFLLFSLLLCAVLIAVIATKKLTGFAVIVAGIIAIYIYAGTGYSGTALLFTFFTIGVLATAWKKDTKRKLRLSEPGHDRRDEKQVLANGGAAGILGLLAWNIPEHASLFLLMLACSLSSAAADTVSSETGIVTGRNFYNIITWKKDVRGENGVVSMEGTLAGMGASLLIAIVYACWHGNITEMAIIVIAGTIGNLVDSVLGASLERRHRIGNNTVNFFNTLAGAFMGWLIYMLLL
jgi:uncharacterized protein (TIGR00297 family)